VKSIEFVKGGAKLYDGRPALNPAPQRKKVGRSDAANLFILLPGGVAVRRAAAGRGGTRLAAGLPRPARNKTVWIWPYRRYAMRLA